MSYSVSREIIKVLLSRVDPGKLGSWHPPGVIYDTQRTDITRDELITDLCRLADSARVHLLNRKFTQENFQGLLKEPMIPVIGFSNGLPFLFEYGKKGRISAHIWVGTTYEVRQFSPEEVIKMTDTDENGEVTLLVPMKADPLVSDDEAARAGKLSPVQRLFRLLRTEKKEILYIYVYALMVGLLSLTLPLGVQAIVGQVSGGLILEPAVLLIFLVILGTSLSGALQIMQAYIVEKIQQRLFARAAFEFADRIPRFKTESILNFYPPELTNRFFDILTIQKGFSKILNEFIGAVLAIFFGLILLSLYHPFFIVFSLLVLSFLFIIFRITGSKGLETSLKESKYKYRVAHWLQEIARTLRTFKLAGISSLPEEKTDREVAAYLTVRQKHFRVLITQFTSIIAFKTVITGGLLILGSILVVNKQITLGQFVASEIVIITILNSVEKIFEGLDVVYDLLTAVEKIGNVTDIEMEPKGELLLPGGSEGFGLEVDNLFYTFPGDKLPVLKDISFKINPGEKIGITGFNNSGKTTLLRVVTGLLSGYEGNISYNGVPLRNLDLNQLRLKIGDIHTSEDIFEGSLLENITLGRPGATMEQVLEAISAVGLREYVGKLPKGLETQMVAGGPNLSSAVVKRIVLARNVIGPPGLLIFNDFFLNLEAEFRHKLRNSILDKNQPWTVLAVTQDPIFLQDCHRIFIMEDGRLVADGPFEEIKNHPGYIKTVVNGSNNSTSG